MTLDGVTVARNSGGDRGVGGISFGAGTGVMSARSTIVADNTAQGLPSNCGGGSRSSARAGTSSRAPSAASRQEVDRASADALLGTELANARRADRRAAARRR